MVEVEKGCLSTFKQDVLTRINSVVQQTDGVTDVWL